MANIVFEDGREFNFNKESMKMLDEIDVKTKDLIMQYIDKTYDEKNLREFILTMYSLQHLSKEAIQLAINKDWESVKKAIIDED